MEVKIKRGIITGVNPSKDGSAVYFKVLTPDSTFSFSTKAASAADLQKAALVPCEITGVLSGGEWERKQFLRFEALQIKAV